MILTLIIGFILIGLEIWYDLSRHKKQANDKPQSTLIWLLLIIMLSLWLPGMYHSNILLFIGQRFMFFDFGYNIARWKSLPVIYTHMDVIRKYSIHSIKRHEFKTFITRLFYHGEGKKKWSYDWVMNKVLFFWPMELLVKIVVFTTVCMDYYMDGSIIDWLVSLFV